MLRQSPNNIPEFERKGYPYGLITDGDPLDRPEGSCQVLSNFDYNKETGELETRNGSINSHLLDGFAMPEGYNIMLNGLGMFSMDEPINREIILLFVQKKDENGIVLDTKIYTNWWYNPPSTPNYETYISGLTADTWRNEWNEITEKIDIGTLEDILVNNLSIRVSTRPPNSNVNFYRGWFIYNVTRALTDSFKCWACIDAYVGDTFTIQNRYQQAISNLGWNIKDTLLLVRYPITIHKQNDWANIERVNMTQKGSNVKILIGQDGNLWFGFLNKDVTQTTNTTNLNIHKYFGWWLDYEQYPTPLSITPLAVGDFYTDPRIGIRASIISSGNATTYLAISVLMDFYQRICIFRFYTSSANTYKIDNIIPYHQYSRRITGDTYYRGGNTATLIDDLTAMINPDEQPCFVGGQYIYTPLYNYGVVFHADPNVNSDKTLLSTLSYSLDEKIYNRCLYGIYTAGRMYEAGDKDKADSIFYSLFQRGGIPTEDISPLQNVKSIDALNQDKITFIELLGINPCIFKNNSLHIWSVEDNTDANMRLVDIKGVNGTAYYRSIVRMKYGLVFANDEGIWLLTGQEEPINIMYGLAQNEYLELTDRSSIFGVWYGKHHEVWMFHSPNECYVFHIDLAHKIPITLKKYVFNYSIQDAFVDFAGNLYFVTTDNHVYHFQNDEELVDGTDADGRPISYSFIENPQNLGDRKRRFKWIQNHTYITQTKKDHPVGNEQLTITVYDDKGNAKKARTYVWDDTIDPETLPLINNINNSMRGIAVGVSGTLNNSKKIAIDEINTQVKLLPQPMKAGVKKVA